MDALARLQLAAKKEQTQRQQLENCNEVGKLYYDDHAAELEQCSSRARARSLGWLPIEPQASAGKVADDLTEALGEAVKNKANVIFSVLGPPQSGKSLAIKTAIHRLAPLTTKWTEQAGMTPLGTPGVTPRGRRNDASPSYQTPNSGSKVGKSVRSLIRVDSISESPGATKRSLFTPTGKTLKRMDSIEEISEETGDRERKSTTGSVFQSPPPDSKADSKDFTRAKTPDPPVGSRAARTPDQMRHTISNRTPEPVSKLRTQDPASKLVQSNRAAGMVAGGGVSSTAIGLGATPSKVGKKINLKPLFLDCEALEQSGKSADTTLFQMIMKELGEVEQVEAQDNSQRLKWLADALAFYTKLKYCIVLVIDAAILSQLSAASSSTATTVARLASTESAKRQRTVDTSGLYSFHTSKEARLEMSYHQPLYQGFRQSKDILHTGLNKDEKNDFDTMSSTELSQASSQPCLLYSLVDMMNQNSSYHFCIVTRGYSNRIFDNFNKRIQSRMELRTFLTQIPSSLHDIQQVLMAHMVERIEKKHKANVDEGGSSADSNSNKKSSNSSNSNNESSEDSQAKAELEYFVGLCVRYFLVDSPCSMWQVRSDAHMLMLDLVIKNIKGFFYGCCVDDKTGLKAIQFKKMLSNTISSRLEAIDPVAAHQNNLILNDLDCVLLIAVYKILRKKRTEDSPPITLEHIKREIIDATSVVEMSDGRGGGAGGMGGGLGIATGNSGRIAIDLRRVTKHTDHSGMCDLSLHQSFHKLLRYGFLEILPTEQLWFRQPVSAGRIDHHLTRWVAECRKKTPQLSTWNPFLQIKDMNVMAWLSKAEAR